jgi:hypothetical protein
MGGIEEGVKALIAAYSPGDVLPDIELVLKISSVSWADTMLLRFDIFRETKSEDLTESYRIGT